MLGLLEAVYTTQPRQRIHALAPGFAHVALAAHGMATVCLLDRDGGVTVGEPTLPVQGPRVDLGVLGHRAAGLLSLLLARHILLPHNLVDQILLRAPNRAGAPELLARAQGAASTPARGRGDEPGGGGAGCGAAVWARAAAFIAPSTRTDAAKLRLSEIIFGSTACSLAPAALRSL